MAGQRNGASEATFSALYKHLHGFHGLQATEHAQQLNASPNDSTVTLHLVNARLASR
jgi:hypothetical protein